MRSSRFDMKHAAYRRRAAAARVIRTRIQFNGSQLRPFPAHGPDEWMWYAYRVTADVPTHVDVVDFSTVDVASIDNIRYAGTKRRYRRTNFPGPIGWGRNMRQALADLARKSRVGQVW